MKLTLNPMIPRPITHKPKPRTDLSAFLKRPRTPEPIEYCPPPGRVDLSDPRISKGEKR